MKVTSNAREVGECIYCGVRDVELGTEHAVPYGLNGPWTLLKASCGKCARITGHFEHGVTELVARPAERPRDAESALGQAFNDAPACRDAEWGQGTIQVPRAEYPTYLAIPLFPPR